MHDSPAGAVADVGVEGLVASDQHVHWVDAGIPEAPALGEWHVGGDTSRLLALGAGQSPLSWAWLLVLDVGEGDRATAVPLTGVDVHAVLLVHVPGDAEAAVEGALAAAGDCTDGSALCAALTGEDSPCAASMAPLAEELRKVLLGEKE